MTLEQRTALMSRLGDYIISDDAGWQSVRERAYYENAWFIPAFIDYQLHHISREYLAEAGLRKWVSHYSVPHQTAALKNIGVVMAGNIPLAGFHDFLAIFMSGHKQTIKPSSKDSILITAIIKKLTEWDEAAAAYFTPAEQLKGCDAYIATGSNNSARYFEYYFSKYPHIIRRNRTSAAILTGNETLETLAALADDIHLYFGLGCRNVTKIYVPENYDFLPLLETFKTYGHFFDHHKYKNNYDYQLAIMIINKAFYMTNGSILLSENRSLFSPISVLHYEFYKDASEVEKMLRGNPDVQCIAGSAETPFGMAQRPSLTDYADGADTLKFLRDL